MPWRKTQEQDTSGSSGAKQGAQPASQRRTRLLCPVCSVSLAALAWLQFLHAIALWPLPIHHWPARMLRPYLTCLPPTSNPTPAVVYFNSISCMPEYTTKSVEELRWEDYQDGCKGGTGAASPAGAFGAPAFAAAPAAGSPFGAPASSPAFGAASSPAFGASAPAFGAASRQWQRCSGGPPRLHTSPLHKQQKIELPQRPHVMLLSSHLASLSPSATAHPA